MYIVVLQGRAVYTVVVLQGRAVYMGRAAHCCPPCPAAGLEGRSAIYASHFVILGDGLIGKKTFCCLGGWINSTEN